MSFFAELRRRNVFKVAAAYAIVGWLLIQVADVGLPAFNAPDWVLQVFIFFIALGFPVALLLSWAYELTPDGVKRTESVPLPESVTRITGRKLDFIVIALLALAVAFMFIDSYLPESGPFAGAEVDPNSLPSQFEPDSSSTETRRDPLPNSVAVLPIENLSPDTNNAFIAAGFHEEILNHLAKLRNLNVISRTSVLQYAEDKPPIREIATKLNVQSVMEGSIRVAGDRIRVTIQLIDPATDVHKWSETYDRQFDDIFEIESDIAMNVANALQAAFSLEEQRSIEKEPTTSSIAYRFYLRAITRWPEEPVNEDLDNALRLDPNFALAHAWKAFYIASFYAPTEESERLIRDGAERALMLDPTIGIAHVALGTMHESQGRVLEANESFEKAYELSPNEAAVVVTYSAFKRIVGHYDEALRASERTVELDPNNPGVFSQLGTSYAYAGDHDAAVAAFQKATQMGPLNIGSFVQLARSEAVRRNDGAALQALQAAEQLNPDPVRLAQLAAVYSRIGRAEESRRLFSELEASSREMPVNDAIWAMAYVGIGNYEEARRRLANAIDTQLPARQFAFREFRIPFTSLKANVWRDPELESPEFRRLRDRIYPLN